MIRLITNLKNNLSINKKIFLFLALIVIISELVIFFSLYDILLKTLTENEIQRSVEYTYKTKKNFELTLLVAENIATQLGMDENLVDSLIREDHETDANAADHGTIETMLENIVNIESFLQNIYVLGNNGRHFSNNPNADYSRLLEKYGDILKMDSYYSHYYVQEEDAGNGLLRNAMLIQSTRLLFDINSGKAVGLIIVEFNYASLKELFDLSSVHNDERVILLDEGGKQIFSNSYLTDLSSFLSQLSEQTNETGSYIQATLFGKKCVVTTNRISNSGWRIISILPMNRLSQLTEMLQTLLTLVALALAVTSLFLSFMLSRTLTKPIFELHKKMLLVEQGDLTARAKIYSNDELGQLGTKFNHMVLRLNSLIDEIVQKNKRKSDLEFQILQAQITPHFLYNTLDSIKWLAIIQDVDNIAEMSRSLTRLLKYNLSVNTITAPLSQEIESIKHYVKIQQYRYGDIFKVDYMIQKETASFKILRFTLQPIVENAIFHGFECMASHGHIVIRSSIQNDNLLLEISDNGGGIPDDILQTIRMRGRAANAFNGIGLSNIQERIELYFGKGYGLNIVSAKDSGTVVSLLMPVILEDLSIDSYDVF